MNLKHLVRGTNPVHHHQCFRGKLEPSFGRAPNISRLQGGRIAIYA
jgi:hypothetical protein